MDIFRQNLSCGSKFVGVPYDSRRDMVALGVFSGYGSSIDPIGRGGATHFGEHLMFKAKSNALRTQFGKVLERNAANDNAETGYTETGAYIELFKQQIPTALDYLIKLTSQVPEFTRENLRTEKGVVSEEISEFKDNPRRKIFDRAFTESYARPFSREILGTSEELEKMTGEEIKGHWRNVYDPKKFIIGAVGNIDFENVAIEFDRRINESILTRNGREQLITPEIKINTPFNIVEYDPQMQAAHICLAWTLKKPNSQNTLRMELINDLFTHGHNNSLFYTRLRQERGLFYSIDGDVTGGPGYVLNSIIFSTDHSKVNEAIKSSRGCIEELVDMPDRELRDFIDTFMRREKTELNRELDVLSQTFTYELDKTPVEEYFKRGERISEITPDEIRNLVGESEFSTIVLTPGKTKEIKI